jgi:hypothetical protein
MMGATLLSFNFRVLKLYRIIDFRKICNFYQSIFFLNVILQLGDRMKIPINFHFDSDN